MKKPEEIKKGLECCFTGVRCGKCPYNKEPLCQRISCTSKLLSDMFSLIQQLEAQVPRWIPVKEKLPDIDPDAVYSDCMYSQELFVFDGKQLAAAYYCHTTKQWHDSRYEDDILNVKYWAQPIPLPEAPKEEHE